MEFHRPPLCCTLLSYGVKNNQVKLKLKLKHLRSKVYVNLVGYESILADLGIRDRRDFPLDQMLCIELKFTYLYEDVYLRRRFITAICNNIATTRSMHVQAVDEFFKLFFVHPILYR